MIPAQVNAQEHALLASFTAIQIEDQVRLDFGIIGGSSCQGVQLERSTDGLIFEVIDVIPGVCGGSEFTEYYTVYDREPVSNQLVYYRLELGQQGRTTPLDFRFVNLIDGVNAFPNPSNVGQEIRISNTFGLSFTLLVFSPSGEEIMRIPSQNSDSFILESNDLDEGIYFLKIFNTQGQVLTTRIVRL